MKLTILSETEIIEGIVGAIMLCFFEYVMHMSWADAKATALAFLGAWCCRKFAVHIYNTMKKRVGILRT